MSHFTIIVIGAAIEAQLAPFHEFECTGIDDQYVIDIDVTEEKRAYYESSTSAMVRLADGSVHNRYDVQFQQPIDPPPVHPIDRKTHFVLPEGAEEFEQKASEIQTFAEWLRDYEYIPLFSPNMPIVKSEDEDDNYIGKYGRAMLDDAGEVTQVIRRTNPNKQWDWYQVGGRWSGYFQVKGEVAEALRHQRALTAQNKPIPDSLLKMVEGVAMGDRSWFNRGEPATPICKVDAAPKGKIDFEQMRNEAEKQAAETYDAFYAIVGVDAIWVSWETMLNKGKAAGTGIDQIHDAYRAQPPIKAMQEAKDDRFSFFFQPDSMLIAREAYLRNARDSAVAPYAIVHEGKWYAKGEMGWWGMSNDTMSQTEWSQKVNELIDSLSDDTLLTLVDAHI